MATTFRLDSHSYQGRYMYLTCTQAADIATNTSTISWTLTVDGGTDNYYTTGPTTVKINGTQVYYAAKTDWSARVFPAARGSVSGTIKVAHNTYGEAEIAVSLTTNIYTGVLKTASGSWVLNDIPRKATVTSAPNFNDEDNPTISYSNLAGNAVSALDACISFTGSSPDIAYRAINKTGSSYTFNLTAAERKVLRTGLANAQSSKIRFYIRTQIGGTYYYDYVEKTLSIVNANPTLSPTVEDINTTTVALTGDKNKLIKFYSNASVKFGASAQKHSTLTAKEVINGSAKLTADGTINGVQDANFYFYAEDSRKLSSSEAVTKPFVNYIKLTCNIANNKPNADGVMQVEASGNYFNGSFGAVSNTLAVYYRYTDSSGYSSSWQAMQITKSGNTYKATYTLTGLDYQKSYSFQCYAADKLATVSSAEISVKTAPIFDWGENDFNFNVPVSIEGDVLTDYIIEQGTEAMGSNGTWYWSKWKSGKAECYGVRNYGNMAVTTAWGGLYRSSAFIQAFPSGLFNDIPAVINIDYRGSNYGGWIAKHEIEAPTKESSGGFIVVRPASATLSQAHIGFNVIGRWK